MAATQKQLDALARGRATRRRNYLAAPIGACIEHKRAPRKKRTPKPADFPTFGRAIPNRPNPYGYF